jgi:hypothetical protein
MKTNRKNNDETKNQKPFLRRKTMKATRLTLIGLAAIAVIFSGCSKDNRITAPGSEAVLDIDKTQSELTAQAEAENEAARMSVSNDGLTQEHLSIVAEVKRTEVEGGCFYLTAESGDNYTPLTPKSLSLELGMVLKASGYIDKDIHFFCGFGPAFVIEEYEILEKSEMSTGDRAKNKAANEKAASVSAQDASSMSQIDKKAAESVWDAASEGSTDAKSQEIPASDAANGKASATTDVNKKKTSLSLSLEDRAISTASTDDVHSIATEDRAPQSADYGKNARRRYPLRMMIMTELTKAAHPKWLTTRRRNLWKRRFPAHPPRIALLLKPKTALLPRATSKKKLPVK